MEIASGNAYLSAIESGMGSPVVLMVHAGVTDQRSWTQVVAALLDHRCLTYDARGYGGTTYQPEDGWSPVEDAVAVLDAYDVSTAVVVGASMGGATAIDLALTHPDRVSALVLIGTAVSGAPDLGLEPGLENLERRYDAAFLAGDLEERNRLEAQLWLDGPFQPEGRVGGEVRELFLEMNGRALAADETGDEREEPDAWRRADEIDVPTLVLVGEYDLRHTRANAAHIAEAITGARLVSLAGAAHLPHLEADPSTLAEIASFVSSAV